MKARQEVTKRPPVNIVASKKEKGEILEQSIATTGYHIQRIAFIPFCLNTDNVIVPFDRRL
jgi:hypothetical protein